MKDQIIYILVCLAVTFPVYLLYKFGHPALALWFMSYILKPNRRAK